MRVRFRTTALALLAGALGACADSGPVAPALLLTPALATAQAIPEVRFAELHYDNFSHSGV